MVEEPAVRLVVYVGEEDRAPGEGRALYKAVLARLREGGVWGATVTRGVAGFGKRSVMHRAAPLRLSADLPIVLEAVDKEAKIRALLPELAALVRDGLLTLEPVTVVTRVGDPEAEPRA